MRTHRKKSTGVEKPTLSANSLNSLKDINIEKNKNEIKSRRSIRIPSHHQNQTGGNTESLTRLDSKLERGSKLERKNSVCSSDSGGIPMMKRLSNKKEILTPYSALFRDLDSVKTFRFYFPNNNIERVLEALRYKRKKAFLNKISIKN